MRVAAQRATGPQIDSDQMLIEESHVDLPAESVAPEERDESTPPAAALNTAPEADKTTDPAPPAAALGCWPLLVGATGAGTVVSGTASLTNSEVVHNLAVGSGK